MSFAVNTKNRLSNLFTRRASLANNSLERTGLEDKFVDLTTETMQPTNTTTSVPIPVIKSTTCLIPITNFESEKHTKEVHRRLLAVSDKLTD